VCPGAELLRRSFAFDVLACRLCGARRKVLAVITDLPVVRRILRHLHLPCGPRAFPALPGRAQLTFEPLELA
jgi:hypothetical protein